MPLLALRVHRQDRNLHRLIQGEVVDAHNNAVAGVYLSLILERRLRDLALEVAVLNGRDDAAHVLDLAEVGVGFFFRLVGQRLDEVAAAQRVDGVCSARLMSDDLLGAQRQARGLLAR